MGTNTARQRRRAAAALILAGTIALAACAGDDDDTAANEAATGTIDDGGGDAAEAPGDEGLLASNDAPGAADRSDGGDAGSGFDIGVVGRDVIVEMRVVMSSDDIQRTVSSIMATASGLGGGVASSEVDYANADDGEGYAVLVVKVPPESVDRLLAGLDDKGTVRSINQSAQDVTEQLVDLDVRITNARRSVTSVREFMDRTQNLNELVTLEAELTRRQTELERLEAQQRNLRDRVALATVTIEIVPTEAVPESEPDDGIGDAFRTGGDAFVGFFFGLALVLAVLSPFLGVAVVVGAVVWFGVRRIGTPPAKRPATAADETSTTADEESVTEPVGAAEIASHED